MPSAIPAGQSGATDPWRCSERIRKVITPATEVTKVDARAAGANFAGWPSGADEDRSQDRTAAKAVDPADATHDCREKGQYG
jgi:hypothetical protein